MRELLLLLASMIQVTVPLLFVKEPSLIPVAIPVLIACATTNLRSGDHSLSITQWSSLGNKCFASCKLPKTSGIILTVDWHCGVMRLSHLYD